MRPALGPLNPLRPACLVLLVVLATVAAAAQEKSREFPAKAAIVFRTVQFTQWPDTAFADPAGPIVVALVGEDVYRGALQTALDGKTAWGRPLALRHYPDPGQVGACHVLVIGHVEATRLGAVLAKVEGKPVLTVSDGGAFLHSGGMVRLFIENNKPHLEVRLKAVEKAGLRISSKLLKLAKVNAD